MIVFLLPLLGSGVAGFFGPFLGSEGTAIMLRGRNILLFVGGMLIFGLIFLFRLFCMKKKKRSRFLLVFFYLLILFLISFYCYQLRVYLLSWFGLCLSGLFFWFFVFRMGKEFPILTQKTPHRRMNSVSKSWRSLGQLFIMWP